MLTAATPGWFGLFRNPDAPDAHDKIKAYRVACWTEAQAVAALYNVPGEDVLVPAHVPPGEFLGNFYDGRTNGGVDPVKSDEALALLRRPRVAA